MARKRYWAPRRTGRSGVTHCGSWVEVPYREEYGWTTRLVCVQEPHEAGQHRSRTGHTWNDGETPGREDR